MTYVSVIPTRPNRMKLPPQGRKSMRAPLSEMMVACPNGMRISRRDLAELRNGVYSQVLNGRIEGFAARLSRSLSPERRQKIHEWMRLVVGKRRLTDELADELAAALVLRVAQMHKMRPSFFIRQIEISEQSHERLVKLAS